MSRVFCLCSVNPGVTTLSAVRQYPNPLPRFFIRAAIANAIKPIPEEARAYAHSRWGDHYMKAGIANTEATNLEADTAPAAEFFKLVFERSVLGRLPGLRQVSPFTRTLRPNNSIAASWVPQSGSIPVSHFDLSGFTVEPGKVS